MRRTRCLAALLLLAGCAAPSPPAKPQPIAKILQDEGTNPMFVPMYLMGPDGTFTTNRLTPEPLGDTH